MKKIAKSPSGNTSGFTLIEMITVIVVLGVLAVGATSFLKFGTQIFTETTARDELISSARFAIERINREVRNAVPNSAKIDANGCLAFFPIVASSIYIDAPVAPESARTSIEVIPVDTNTHSVVVDAVNQALHVVIYPTNAEDDFDIGSNKNHRYFIIDGATRPWVIEFNPAIIFDADSPTHRIYFYNKNFATRFCLEGSNLIRYSGANAGVLMAEHIKNSDSSFSVGNATQLRNATVQARLVFALNTEEVAFNNEVQIPNVP